MGSRNREVVEVEVDLWFLYQRYSMTRTHLLTHKVLVVYACPKLYSIKSQIPSLFNMKSPFPKKITYIPYIHEHLWSGPMFISML